METALSPISKEALIEHVSSLLGAGEVTSPEPILRAAADDGALLDADHDFYGLLAHVINNVVESGDIEQGMADLRSCTERINIARWIAKLHYRR